MNLSSIRPIPFVIIVVLVAFSVRLADVVVGVSNLSGAAVAADDAPKSEDEHAADDHGEEEKLAQADDAAADEAPSDSGMSKWRDANDVSSSMEDVKVEMFKDLANRRDELDQREKDLKVREAMLEAASREVDKKVQELNKLRQEIEGLLDQHSEQEENRIGSLVKIYEGMKPKDAARIFDTLDMDVLVSVFSRMSERKIAPILAAMDAERARNVTIMLAEEKTLPTLQ